MSTMAPAAGWYRDPSDVRVERWWTGRSWTAWARPAGKSSTPHGSITSPLPVKAKGRPGITAVQVAMTVLTAGCWLPVWWACNRANAD